MTKLEEIHQGTELEKDQSFVALICDIDDIKGRAKENGEKLTKKQLKEVYEYAKRKLADIIMEDFWLSIDTCLSSYEDVKKWKAIQEKNQ